MGVFVGASVPGLAAMADLEVEECRAALEKLSGPDPDSRTADNDGRKIRAVEGGWVLLNYVKYQEKMHEISMRASNARRQADFREREKRRQKKLKVRAGCVDGTADKLGEAGQVPGVEDMRPADREPSLPEDDGRVEG